MEIQHKILAAGRWQILSFAEQMANIGSEISRAVKWQNRDAKIFGNSIKRALELIDLTMVDTRWRKRLKELARIREFLVDAVWGGGVYNTSLKDLEHYFLYFAVAVRIQH